MLGYRTERNVDEKRYLEKKWGLEIQNSEMEVYFES